MVILHSLDSTRYKFCARFGHLSSYAPTPQTFGWFLPLWSWLPLVTPSHAELQCTVYKCYTLAHKGDGLGLLDLGDYSSPDVVGVRWGITNTEGVWSEHRHLLLHTIELCHALERWMWSCEYHVIVMWLHYALSLVVVSYLDPTLSWGKGSGGNWGCAESAVLISHKPITL